MLHLKQIVRASKSNIKVGQWRSGKVPKADFPMARSAYALGNSFRWCVISFETLGAECKVLVVINEPKQKYEAVLGVMGPIGLRILCTYEYHATEPGWHTHATHVNADTLSHGYMRGPWIKRIPGPQKLHRANKFPKFKIGDETAAIRFAYDRYKIREKGTLL
ncbi:MAG TPA: hypothetical protein VMH84_18995 [Xanthobacteraceae bacterium]|nr:hypothetical protein [Xanthobacteraceae bacterium]